MNKMGRPVEIKDGRKPVQVIVDYKVWKKVREEAVKKDTTTSRLVEQILRDYFAEKKQEVKS